MKKALKLHVKVKPLKLEGLLLSFAEERIVVLEMKWKGPPKRSIQSLIQFNGSNFKCQKNFSSHKFLKEGSEAIEWDNEEFDHICNFSAASWDVKLKVFYGRDSKSKTKLEEMGYTYLDLAELLAVRRDGAIQKKLPVSLQVDAMVTRAILSVSVSFAETRDPIDSPQLVLNSPYSDDERVISKMAKTPTFSRRKITSPPNSNELTLSNSDDSPDTIASQLEPCPSSATKLNSGLQGKLFPWKKKGWSFTPSKRKNDQNFENGNAAEIGNQLQKNEYCITGRWDEKELISRDGFNKLKANLFFASFDQRSKTAAGESACAALVAVIAHWLSSNRDFMPTTSEFDGLIKDGCSEWRKLCMDKAYANRFPDDHFDLETVLKADIRPLNISENKSFTGIFNPEKFEHLKGAKSFDDIWEEISSNAEDYDQGIYIVSWNDHFFVLKAEADAYYIVDSLGERLFEGCNQAYILKFDDSSIVYGKTAKNEANSGETRAAEEIICRGKDCCREFIKRFLAAILLRELENDEIKGTVSTSYLLQRLQIDFHYCHSSSSSSFSTSPASSIFSSEECKV